VESVVKDISSRIPFLKQVFSRRGLSIFAVLFIAFLTSGGIYAIINSPPTLVSTSSGNTYIYHSATSETSSELFVIFLLTVTGAAGFILLEEAFKKSFDLGGARMKFLLGIVLVLLAVGLLESLTYIKLH